MGGHYVDDVSSRTVGQDQSTPISSGMMSGRFDPRTHLQVEVQLHQNERGFPDDAKALVQPSITTRVRHLEGVSRSLARARVGHPSGPVRWTGGEAMFFPLRSDSGNIDMRVRSGRTSERVDGHAWPWRGGCPRDYETDQG